MKKNRILKLGLLALALVLVTTSIMSSTLAKYVTTVNATGSVQVARWSAALKQGNTTFNGSTTINLFEAVSGNGDVTDNEFAPGMSGSFTLTYDTSGSEVDHEVTVKLTKLAGNMPSNFKFTINPSQGSALGTASGLPYTFKKTIKHGDVSKTGNIVVDWVWPYETTNGDSNDTLAGISEYNFKINAEFTAVQSDTYPITSAGI